MTKRLIAFDLDGTLAQSKQPITDMMAARLAALLDKALVAVISGGDWPQFEKQVVDRLPSGTRCDRLLILPTSGAKLYRLRDGAWQRVYAQLLSEAERNAVRTAIDEAVDTAGLSGDRTWGERIEDRGSQITFSGLGQEAPLDAKTAWDPDFAKRRRLQALLAPALPELSVKVGGSTSIDITQKGIDKAFGMHRLSDETGVPFDAMLFFGDALYDGGNDHPVAAAGIDSIAVRDPEETATAVAAITCCL